MCRCFGFRVTNSHRQLELSKGANGPARRIGNFDIGVHVHVGGSEMSDGEGVAAEIDCLESVIHRQLCAKGVIDTGAEKVGLGFDNLAHSSAGMKVTCGGNFVAGGEEWAFTKLCNNHSNLSNI